MRRILRYGALIEARSQRRGAPTRAKIRTHVPDAEVAAVRDVRFSTSIRGYDRDEVDRYISRVNQVIAELQITAAPESAVKYALEESAAEGRSVIQDAHASAEEITARSRSRADDRIQEATEEAQKLLDAAEQEAKKVGEAAEWAANELREAAERHARTTREAAEGRIRDLDHHMEAMSEKRDQVIAELQDLARSLDDLVEARDTDRAPSTDREPAQVDRAG